MTTNLIKILGDVGEAFCLRMNNYRYHGISEEGLKLSNNEIEEWYEYQNKGLLHIKSFVMMDYDCVVVHYIITELGNAVADLYKL